MARDAHSKVAFDETAAADDLLEELVRELARFCAERDDRPPPQTDQITGRRPNGMRAGTKDSK